MSETQRAADLPDRLLADRALVMLPGSFLGSPLAGIEVLVQEGLTCLSLPASQIEELHSLTPMYSTRALFAAHGIGTAAELQRALDAGVALVSLRRPDADLVATCRDRGMPVLVPGLTPTEVQQAWDAGASAVLVVPADAFGGQYAEQLAALAPEATLVPCGGVGAYSGGRWLEAGAAAVCLDDALIGDAFEGGQLSSLRERAQTFCDAIERH